VACLVFRANAFKQKPRSFCKTSSPRLRSLLIASTSVSTSNGIIFSVVFPNAFPRLQRLESLRLLDVTYPHPSLVSLFLRAALIDERIEGR
jgi:hypothetical protein